ncbi:MAG: glycoside hydrolase family 18 protein [Clostridia bacterium]|nr:glycoside hydrolase family 18 protein [Clostridia bacterium]
MIERIVAYIMAVINLITGFFGIDKPVEKTKVENFRVTSYVIADRIQNEASICTEDFDIITDVIIFGCATFDSKGKITVQEDILVKALSNLRKVIGERDIKITLNLLGPGYTGSSTDWYEQMEGLGKEHNKAFMSPGFEKRIVDVIDKYGFDGIHFDYEYPINNFAWFNFNNFLVSLRAWLGEKRTLGVAISDWNLNLSTAAVAAVDTIEFMLYDMYDEEGKHSTAETAKMLSKKIWDANIPLEKVNFGLPFYARPSDRDSFWYDYVSYYSELDENGWYRDENIGKDFWFNTPDVIEDKTDYAINEGFGGVMIWHYSCDLPSTNEKSLLRAIGTAVDNNY